MRPGPLFLLLLTVTWGHPAPSGGDLENADAPLNRTDRVVGGTEVERDSVRWVASLQYRNARTHFCGGTIISDRWVLTAAHCMVHTPKETFQVVTGGTDLDEPGLQVTLPEKVVIADYDEVNKYRDLALIKLSSPLQLRSGLDALRLTEESPRPHRGCWVLGWGSLASHEPTVRRLQRALVRTRTNQECRRAYRAHNYAIDDTMLCAGGGTTDACQGDSGGPLVCRHDGGDLRSAGGASSAELRLAGAVSWGVGCASPGLPGVYANIASMRDWVERTMAEN